MPIEDVHEFVQELEKAGELKKISTEVNADLEIAEILRRVMYTNGPAVLFENVKGYDIPVLGNAFGSIKRLELGLETSDFTEIGQRIVDMTKMDIPSGIFNKIKKLPELSKMSESFPKLEKSGPVTEIKDSNPNFETLPIIKTWPKDANKFITFGLVATKHPETGIRNLGVYRMQILDDTHALMHWQKHKRGAHHSDIKKGKQEKIEAAIIIGSEPATVFSAVAPVPEGLDKYLFAGITRKRGIKTVKCQTIDLEVPANAEIVLEGYVDPSDLKEEGPFGDHTGYYTPREPYPTFTLTGMMRRNDPIYLTTVVGKPILEDAFIGKVVERSFLPLIRMFHPEVVDFSMPASGWFQGFAIISIKKRYPGQAKKVMMGLWGMGQLSLTKMFVVVDNDVNVHDMNDVLWAITTRADPARDTTIIDNAPTDTLDPASPLVNLGSKLGIDATQKSSEEGFQREIQEQVEVDKETKNLVDSKWSTYGF
ncbi:MAG: menaquinone biosynthesis decarboxylase [Nitrosopumilaceae archaeon]|nr:menaquinone biosynthesis decarboxylase [Nitrosopumilaceae archaeon]NIU00124.1 menaquinone biosynthesis decarboxylase [Nitrosopumilaceae archaeon]NIU86514.1 menaquinone biosynthesis decarboxylase [Nitrosopumilaceae archaeon]NIV65749.1 menaquinone biosynthesis decarboxylase [Nitrosopumilaceae archaeon]NIX60726.1 menaquinone biosynthesis decarboxylase [Nitrosopumilaceae archaeon]